MLEALAARIGNVAATNILEVKDEKISLREVPSGVSTDPHACVPNNEREIKRAAESFRRDISTMSCCIE